MSDVFSQLRNFLDGNDPFMTRGHQIIKTAGATQHAQRMQSVPVWALDDNKIKELLMKVFPRMQTDPKQKERAMRWLRIINLYYRVGWTCGRVAEELKITYKQAEWAIYAINKAAKGEADHGRNRGIKPRGRPRKFARV